MWDSFARNWRPMKRPSFFFILNFFPTDEIKILAGTQLETTSIQRCVPDVMWMRRYHTYAYAPDFSINTPNWRTTLAYHSCASRKLQNIPVLSLHSRDIRGTHEALARHVEELRAKFDPGADVTRNVRATCSNALYWLIEVRFYSTVNP